MKTVLYSGAIFCLIITCSIDREAINSSSDDELADSSLVKVLNLSLVEGLKQQIDYLDSQTIRNHNAILFYGNLKAQMAKDIYNAGFLFPIARRFIADSLSWRIEPKENDYILVFSQVSGIKEHIRFSVFAKGQNVFERWLYDEYHWQKRSVYNLNLEVDILDFFNNFHLSNDQGNLSIVWIIRNGQIQAFPLLTSSGWFDERELCYRNELK